MSRPHLNRRQLLGGAAALGLVDALRGGTLAQWMSSDAHAQTTPRAPAPTRRWQNWSGLQQATPATWAAPAHEAELQQLLRRTRGEVRAVGAGHSFTALVPTDQTLVSLDRLHGIVSIDRAAMTVTAHAGTRIGALAKALDAQGLALRNQPDVDVQTLAGAIAATFIRRGMAVPTSLPVGLTYEFSGDATRQALWHAFLKKNELAQQTLPDVVAILRAALGPALLRAADLNGIQK